MAADAAASWLKIVDEDLRQVVNNLQGPLPFSSACCRRNIA